MIRAETEEHWLLVTHPDHAQLAGVFADAWGNARFARPGPDNSVRIAVVRHDDGWIARDAAPLLTRDGRPEAFTRTLVGAYSAFEEIDLPAYLQVRGDATAAVAREDPHAGILVSMHTVSLLTEMADPASIRPEHRAAHAEFVAGQRAWQDATAARIGADPAALRRGFEFLQACDNLSLLVCSGFDQPRDLRHTHPDRSGNRHTLRCSPVGDAAWRIAPWPFGGDLLVVDVPYRKIARADCADLPRFRAAFAAAPVEFRRITLTAD